MADQTETTSGAQCPACKYVNDMPSECLRDHWQDLDCDRCGQALEFRGVSCPDTTWEFEIHTRTVVASWALFLPMKAVYFDQIKAGEKHEEYRLDTPFWAKRLERRRYGQVILTRGYPKGGGVEGVDRLTLRWRGWTRKSITHPHFGPAPVDVFAIDVTERVA